jgi:hypothetical protein
MSTLGRRRRSSGDNNRNQRRRLNPPERPMVTLRVYSSNYSLMMSPDHRVFPMELVPNKLQLYLEERLFPSFICPLTGIIYNYPPGVIYKEEDKYYLEIALADIQDYGRAEGYDLENTEGIPAGRTEGSIKIEITMIDGALDNIDGMNGPMKFYIREPVSFDALFSRVGFYVPTNQTENLRAHEARDRYIREMNNPFQQGQGSAAGFAIGGKRRRKKRTKKKSRRKKRKTKKRRKKKTRKKRGGYDLYPRKIYFYKRVGSNWIFKGTYIQTNGTNVLFNDWSGSQKQGENIGRIGGDGRSYTEDIRRIEKIWRFYPRAVQKDGGPGRVLPEFLSERISTYGGGKRRKKKKRTKKR